ncbi:MAG: hypothetical protein ACRCUP_05790 [Mycoplasmatales bacterium]
MKKKKSKQTIFLIVLLGLMLGGMFLSLGKLTYDLMTTKVIEYQGQQIRIPKELDITDIPGAKEVK